MTRRWWIAFVVSPLLVSAAGLLTLYLWNEPMSDSGRLLPLVLGLLAFVGLLVGMVGLIWGITGLWYKDTTEADNGG